MQLYALNAENRIISAAHAHKHQDYWCLECHKRVRLRGGFHHQSHFFHLESNRHCRLYGKGMVHLQIQHHLLQQLPSGECQLEYRFKEIQRIADVAWIPYQIVFEIQCSPISATEIQQRNADYKKMGWEVVWILHEHRYNQKCLTAAEFLLRSSTHYFTNIDKDGQGIIYDQFDLIMDGLRCHRLEPLPVQINQFKWTKHQIPLGQLRLITYRLHAWSLSFKGDLIDVNSDKENFYLKKAEKLEREALSVAILENQQSISWKESINYFFNRYIRYPYFLIFQMILERFCR